MDVRADLISLGHCFDCLCVARPRGRFAARQRIMHARSRLNICHYFDRITADERANSTHAGGCGFSTGGQ